MTTGVFANGQAIACKAGSGKTICAFPDVCFTPPETPATPPGVPIPYPNTAMISDMADGSKDVLICDEEICLEDASKISKSTGDEAGSAAKKGVVTSKNTGAAYFVAWSMDVVVEGKSVDRNLDMTTHNHASMPGNTPPYPFIEGAGAGLSSPGVFMKPRGGDKLCFHDWGIEDDSKLKRSAEQKIRSLEKKWEFEKDIGARAEAAAARHNEVTRGDCLSGAGQDSKIHYTCTRCGAQGREIDHVERDENGKVTATVSVKGGKCPLKPKQFRDECAIAAKLGIVHKFKLESGEGAERAKKLLSEWGFDLENVITV